VLAAALFAPAVPAAEPPAPSPVEELRQALLQQPGPDGVDAYKTGLRKRLDALNSVGGLAEVLGFDLWPAEAVQPRQEQESEPIRFTREFHLLVRQKLFKQIRKAFTTGDAATQAAAAILLGSTAAAEREQRMKTGAIGFGPNQQPREPFAELGADLITLMKAEDAAVRRAAVRALVEVGSEPEQTVAAVGRLLDSTEKDPSVRRAAAAALEKLLDSAGRQNAAMFGSDPKAEAGFIRLESQAVPAAALGLADGDEAVRRRCLAALRRILNALTDLTRNPWRPGFSNGFNDPQQQLAVLEQAREKSRLVLSLAGAANKVLPAVARALEDDKADAAVAAAAVLESAATARIGVRRWDDALSQEKLGDAKPSADPLPALLGARPSLAKNLSRPEIRVRLAAVYVLEALGPDAAPASETLAKALGEDADAFVRWGAARALGKMAPGQSRDAVPALAKALADKSADVRLTAAVALRRFGPTAKEAVAALAAAVKRDDGARLEALKTLAVVGAEAGPAAKESAVAAAVALADPDPEVRVAAAHALAHVGPADEDSRKALRKALDDPDDAVRGAAAAALLSGK
jgi:HEAT repeat protein